mgnify:FL=1
MKEVELLTILTNVRGEYILQAQELRSGNRKQPLCRIHRKRVFLIAAVISLLLLLVGCAAVLIGLQKVHLGQMEFSDLLWQEGQSFERDVLSLNGYVDSPGYRATQEWLAFENSYDKDRTLLQNADSDDYELPQDYYAYLCYTQEMQDKIDEICGKYGLELAGPVYFADHTEEVLTAVMVPSIANVDSHSDLALEGGRYYRSGSFLLSGTLQHRFEDRQNVDTVMFSYSCDKKNVFFPGYITTEDMNTFDVWEYTAWDGAQLLLAQNKERGLILADTGDCFTSIVLYFSLGEVIEVDNPGLRTDMEEIADAFAYNIQPKAPGLQWLDNPNGLYSWESPRTYDEYFSHWLPGSVGSEAYSPDYQQKFVDLDEDGTDEMLIWNARTGVVYEVVTRVDGELQCLYSGDIFLTEDSTRMYLCQGNTLEKVLHGELYGRQWNEYHRMEYQQLMPVEVVMEGNDGKFYWSESGGASSLMWKEISEAEYNAVRAKYVRIPGTLGSLPELSEEAKSQLKNEAESRLLQVMMDQYAFYRPDDGLEYYLTDYCRRTGDQLGFPVSITRYAFVDMDGDGTVEAVVDFKFGENEQVMCMVLKYDSGTVYGAEFYHRQMSHIKKDGTFAYSGGGDNDGWAKLRWENNTWVNEPAPDATNKEDVTWVSYPITADVHSDVAFSLFREVFMPMSEGAAKPTMENLRTLAGEAGYYVDAHYEFDFLILMPGSKLSGTQKDGLLTDMVYTLYLPPLEGNADLYTLEVGVENLNTDSPQYCIYRPRTTPIVANSANDLAEYINWHRIHPRDSYTNWDPSMIIN